MYYFCYTYTILSIILYSFPCLEMLSTQSDSHLISPLALGAHDFHMKRLSPHLLHNFVLLHKVETHTCNSTTMKVVRPFSGGGGGEVRDTSRGSCVTMRCYIMFLNKLNNI